jgi:hypothetical protein
MNSALILFSHTTPLHDGSQKDDDRLQEYARFFKAHDVHDLLNKLLMWLILKIAYRGLFVQLQCSRDGRIVIERGLVPFVTAEY